jgi:hypothetical protein
MENFFFEFNGTVIQLRKNFTKKYNIFLDSKFFWIISFVIIPIFYVAYTIFFYKINLYLGIMYFAFSAIIIIGILPPIYYKIKGRDFFKEMRKHFANKKNAENSLVVLPISKNSLPISDDILKKIYDIISDLKVFDISLLSEDLEIKHKEIFSFEYFKQTMNDLKIFGKTDFPLYFIANQRKVANIIYEGLFPFLELNKQEICNYVFYYIKNDFSKVNYKGINAENKRENSKTLKKQIEDLRKSYDILK